ncbi:hypothetical protein Tco_0156889 [Tanacetum coccineum]
MDDEPMWAADRVVDPTPGSEIIIPQTANEFAIKGNAQKLPSLKSFQRQYYQNLLSWSQRNNPRSSNGTAGGIFLYRTSNQAYQLLEDKVLLKLDYSKKQKTKSSFKKIVAFAAEGSSNSNTDKIMAKMDAMTIKMDAQYKDFQSRSK